MALDDYLALEQPLVDRLREQVPELRAVTTAAELGAVADMRQQAPAAIVIYDGDDIPQGEHTSARSGERQVVDQRWLVVIAVQNVRDQRHGTSVRRDAGPLMRKVMLALKGWQPPIDGVRPLKRVSAPGPAFETGYGYFPLAFVARVID